MKKGGFKGAAIALIACMAFLGAGLATGCDGQGKKSDKPAATKEQKAPAKPAGAK